MSACSSPRAISLAFSPALYRIQLDIFAPSSAVLTNVIASSSAALAATRFNHPPGVPGGGVPPQMSTIADVLNRATPPYKSHQIGKVLAARLVCCTIAATDGGWNSPGDLTAAVTSRLTRRSLAPPPQWHGGMSRKEQLPVNRGFTSSLGYLSGAEDHFMQTRNG